MTDHNTLTQIIAQQGQTDQELVAIFGAKLALDHMTEKLATTAARETLWGLSEGQLDGAFNAEILENRWRDGGRELALFGKATTARLVIESHPRYAEALATVGPLHAEALRLTAKIESDRLARQFAEAAAEEALRVANERAAAAAAADPAVVAARRALEALTAEPTPPPAPFRGRVTVKAKDTGDNLTGAILADIEN
jgi:hypothetical protein